MVLPVGVTALGTFQGAKGEKGLTGSLAFATAESIAPTDPVSVEMVGPEEYRGAHFKLPRGLDGVNAVENDTAVGGYVTTTGTVTRQALDDLFARGISVLSFGAVGDGITDDSVAIRDAVNAAVTFGAQVWLPRRTYLVSRVDAATAYAIGLPSGASLVSEGATLKLADAQLDYTSVLKTLGAGTSVRGLVIDGNKAAQSAEADHRRHGVFIDAPDASILDCRIINCAGDGVLLYTNSERATISNTTITGCKRSGVAIVGAAHELSIDGLRSYGNTATPIDGETEGVVAQDVHIRGSFLAATAGEYALTTGGTTQRNLRWVIEGNTILGAVSLLRSDKTRFIGNTVRTTAGAIPALTVSITDQTLIQGNEIDAFARGIVGLYTLGTAPSNVTIIANDIRSVGNGIELSGILDATVAHNRIIGTGTGSGILISATAGPVTDVDVSENKIRNYATGATFSTAGGFTMNGVSIDGNKFRDTQTTPTMTIAIRFAGAGTSYSNIRQGANFAGAGVTTLFSDATSPAPVPLVQAFYNKAPITKPASPGVAAGSDAGVINAIVTALRNLGLVA